MVSPEFETESEISLWVAFYYATSGQVYLFGNVEINSRLN